MEHKHDKYHNDLISQDDIFENMMDIYDRDYLGNMVNEGGGGYFMGYVGLVFGRLRGGRLGVGGLGTGGLVCLCCCLCRLCC